MKKGKFVVVDGLDGVGKGVFLKTFVDEAKKDGKRVFDTHQFWSRYGCHPSVDLIIGKYDLIITSEPTYVGIGKKIREEMIIKGNNRYTPQEIAEAYAEDRMILYKTLLLPILETGIDVYQSRSFSTTIIYQKQSAMDQGLNFDVSSILSIPGNRFCSEHPMDILVIPTIKNVAEVMRRLNERKDIKDDNCTFETIEFQMRIKQLYESAEFKSLFESLGVQLFYPDAGKELHYSIEQAREIYQNHLKSCE